MTSDLPLLALAPRERWRMPVVPEQYDRRSLSEEECWALEQLISKPSSRDKASQTARQLLSRFNEPVADVYRLRHQREQELAEVHRVIRQEMLRRRKTFWEWTPEEWIDFLCPTVALFNTTRTK